MNPKELRIGNLVKYDGRIFEIYGIDKEYPHLNTYEFGVGVVEWDDIECVPLTEDILRKVGFGGCDKYGLMNLVIDSKYRNSFALLAFPSGVKGLYLVRYCVNDYWGAEMDCQHLHQLQNLYFALTGEELNTEGIK